MLADVRSSQVLFLERQIPNSWCEQLASNLQVRLYKVAKVNQHIS